MLTEDKRRQLDDIVGKMAQNGETDDSISFVVSDFKNKYAVEEPDKSFLEKTAGVLDMVFGGGKIGEAIGTKIAENSKAGKELKRQEAQGILPQGTTADTFKQPTKGQLAGSALQSAALFIPAGAGAKGITTGARALGMKTGTSALGKIGSGAAAGYVFDVANNLQQGKTGAQALPPGLGSVIGGAIPAAGVAKNVIVRFGDKQAPRIINSLIKPLQKDFAYGKNPGRAVAEEGIVANNFDELITKIRDSRQATGQAIGTLSESLSTAPIISIRNSLSPLDDAIKVAASQNNQTLISRLNNVKRTLTEVLEPAFDDAGNITIKSVGSRDLENLTFKQVRNVLGDVGELTQFTGNPSDDKLVNMALKQIYGKIKGESLDAAKKLNSQVAQEFEKLTEKYGDLMSAEVATKYRDKIIERQNLIGLSPQTAGIASGLLTAVATGGAAIPTIAVGLSGAVLEKLASTPGFKTRLAYLLSNKTQREATYLFRKIPALSKFFTLKAGATPGDVILSEVKKTLDEAKTLPNKQGGFVRIGKETPKEINLIRAGDIKGEGVGKGGLFFSDSKDAIGKLNLDGRKVTNFTIKSVPDNQKYVATSQFQAVDDFLPEGRLKEYFKMLSVEGYTPEQFIGDKIGRRKFFDTFDRELSRKGIDTWTHDGKRKLMEFVDSKIKQAAEKKGIKLIQYTNPDEVSFFAEAGKRNDYVVLDKSIISTPKTVDNNFEKVYHAGKLEGGIKDGIFTTPNKVDAESYFKNRGGKINEFLVDKSKLKLATPEFYSFAADEGRASMAQIAKDMKAKGFNAFRHGNGDLIIFDKSLLKQSPTLPKSKVNESVSSLNDTTLTPNQKLVLLARENSRTDFMKLVDKNFDKVREGANNAQKQFGGLGEFYEKFGKDKTPISSLDIEAKVNQTLKSEVKNYKTFYEFVKAKTDPAYEFKSGMGIKDKDIARGTFKEAINDIGGLKNVQKGTTNILNLKKTENINTNSQRYKKVLEEVKKGERTPLIIDENMEIMDGHHRLEAYRELGLKEIPVIAPKGTSITTYTKSQLKDIWNKANKSSLQNNKQAGFVNLGLDEIANRKPLSGEKALVGVLAGATTLGMFNKLLSDQMTKTEEKAYRKGLADVAEIPAKEIKLQQFVPEEYKPVIIESTKGLKVRPEEVAALIQTENAMWDEEFVNPQGTDTGLGQHNAATYEDINRLYKKKYGKSYNRKNGEENIKATALWLDHLLEREGINGIDDAVKAYRIGVQGLMAVRQGKGTARFTEQELRDMANDKLESYKQALNG